jgi:hypothetical protein
MNIQLNIPTFLRGHVKFINWWHVIFLNKYGPVTADRHVSLHGSIGTHTHLPALFILSRLPQYLLIYNKIKDLHSTYC